MTSETVLPDFDDPVQIVYEALCEVREPPRDQHWEGWVARHIIRNLREARWKTMDMFPQDGRTVEILYADGSTKEAKWFEERLAGPSPKCDRLVCGVLYWR